MKPEALRQKCYEMLVKADDGHCGSVMSLIEILCAIHETFDLTQHKLIISKAHGAMAVYPILEELGLITRAELESFRKSGSKVTMFPNMTIPGIPATLGSMGHGLGIAAGMALARPEINVICIMGEGELYEGSVWEALLFIAHHNLDNVRIVIDRNGYIVMGQTEKLLALDDVNEKFRAFNFQVGSCNGHDVEALKIGLAHFQVVIAETVKGKGIAAWEGKPESHYWIKPHVPA